MPLNQELPDSKDAYAQKILYNSAPHDASPLCRLKVLVTDEEIPYPLNSGKRIRTWNLLRHLAHRHEITFLCYGVADNPAKTEMENLGIRVLLVSPLSASHSARFYMGAMNNLISIWPYSVARHHTHRFTQRLEQLLDSEPYDLVHFEWTPYASYIDAVGKLPTLIMAHNIETTVWQRRAQYATSLPERLYMRLQARKMEYFERRCFPKVRKVAVVTRDEQETASQWGARSTSLVDNGVDTAYMQPVLHQSEGSNLLFLGSLDWQPNRDALQYLLREIFPEIRSAHPTVELHVVGRQSGSKLREQIECLQGVEWIGEVPDIRPHFANASVVLVPLRIGGGSRIKILEAMAMGKAVVSTQVGAEGLQVENGIHCLIANSAAEFSRHVGHLLSNPEFAAQLGANGRKLVQQQYDWSGLAAKLEMAWLSIANGN